MSDVLFGMWTGLACGVCHRKATHFTTRAGAPERPETELGDDPPPMPAWYACPDHLWPCHKLIVDPACPPVCEHCGEPSARWVPCQTSYSTSLCGLNAWQRILRVIEDPPDPNRDLALCGGCAEDYVSYYDELREGYYLSQF